ncbi:MULTISPECIES: hypothetical protein [Prochlorococcus]|uniref:Uncharacterized protein n=1 Tax=Prochlorococcus marinus (strain SARG / CCMP1375 / SS120) TaxID=167539 RepID=Q7VCL7_PROMA|nr:MULTISPECIES: hypothetical protein [Prochlorococcus]AAP99767.1 Predicted protein [Prochlorococcus marinus subsp. marinus str. CCMP1375]KGG12757.1 hypothetical protein EV04_0701 [Prochlorococcus marinus str. LG]KGG22468.1 hypothetical protein EV08_0109 [Prochlorococcus marinus str. SS2]KGG23789.1 hypothetical protein EV09_0891 [Prochlorococcus marinus str. SS35]KGG31998.1 hypothetical protein EV10_1112 [Prochlorococcus marinus str. SS51]
MSNLSEINPANQILSFVIAAGLVAFVFLLLRLTIAGVKFIGWKIKSTFPQSAEAPKKNKPKRIQNK